MITINSLIKDLFLFEGIDEHEVDALIDILKYETNTYQRGELVFSPEKFEKKIGFILDGECEIIHTSRDESRVVLNVLKKGDSFGILAVFRDESFPTEVYVKRKTKILFLESNELLALIDRSSRVSLNIIRFLAKRVGFLNNKIETVTKGGVEKKLSSYLIQKSNALTSDEFEINMKKCAESIGAGRASVYRAMDALITRRYLSLENKKIKILDKQKMEEFIK